MDRTGAKGVTGWPMVLLLPLALPLAITAGLLSKFTKPKLTEMSADEVEGFIKDLLDETGGPWDWDEFENMPLADPSLESIRKKAAMAGPPNVDRAALEQLLEELQALKS